jgi:ATP-dependent metalloprotease FtsH
MSYNLIIPILALLLLPYLNTKPNEITSDYYFDNFVDNTTQIKVYGNNVSDIYLNNETSTNNYINNTKSIDFLKRIKKYENKFNISYSIDKKSSFKVNENIILGIILFFIYRHFKNGFSNNIIIIRNSKTKLKDIAGLEYAKKEIFEFIDFLKNKEKYIKAGAKMPRGALLYGPPGTGKTLLAKAISGECGIPFITTTGSDFAEVYVGVGASRVRDLFAKAKKHAPCIIFIDEIDALARKRGTNMQNSGSSERDATLNKLLVELDGFDENDNILIFGSTNRLDVIDNAILRPGRFDRKIRFELPEMKEREVIFKHYLDKLKLDGNPEEIAESLSKQSMGFSGADIANICNEASILSVRNNLKVINLKILENAIDNIILGPEKTTFRLSNKEREIIAYHEAGHTIMSYFLVNVTSPIKVSIMPRGKSALGFSQREMSENKLKNKDEILDEICVLLGGRVAEEIYIRNITTGASDDIQRLTELAYMYVTIYGMDKEINIFHFNKNIKNRYSEETKKDIDESVKKIINKCYEKTKKLLSSKEKRMNKLAKELLDYESLNKQDLDDILKS